jgi:hypothetical protein
MLAEKLINIRCVFTGVPAGVRSAKNAHWSRARSADVRTVQGVHTNCRVSYSAERVQVVAVADVVGLELLSYNKVKALRFDKPTGVT